MRNVSVKVGQPDYFDVTRMTGLERITQYHVEHFTDGGKKRVLTYPDGTQSTRVIAADYTHQDTLPDGTQISLSQSGNPRFGLLAPVQNWSITTPGGKSLSVNTDRSAVLPDPKNLFNLKQTDVTTVNGRPYTRVYDSGTKTFTTTTPVGRQVTAIIDAQGRVTQSQLAGLDAIQFTYDTQGRLITATQGAGTEERSVGFAYNANGYVDTVTDPLGRTASFVYDTAGRVTSQMLPDGRVVGYTYDANDNLTSVTPPSRPAHGFTYTPVDLTSEYNPPAVTGGGKTTYTYDLDRQITKITRPDGQTIDFAYDSAGRINTVTTHTDQYVPTYDAQGRLSGLLRTGTSGNEGLSYTYDGNLTLSTTWTGPVAGSVSRTFDNDFRVVSQSVNGANTINFTYDNDSLLTQAGVLTLSRNTQNGLMTGTTLGVVSDTWTYHTFGEPTAYSATANSIEVYAASIVRDNLGRITQKTETIGGATNTFDYAYDLAGRLIEVKKNGTVTSTYTYDANGNRLTHNTTTGTYDAQDRLLTYSNNTYTYSANGELQTKTVAAQTTMYTYDVMGNLRAATLANGTVLEYVIDGQNRRIGKKVNGTLVQGWLYDDQLQIIAELDGTGNVVSRFVYGDRANVPSYMVKGGITYRIISDHLGSPRLVVNTDNGSIAQRIDYDEWGSVLADTSPGFQPFGFASGLYDWDTKLVRFGARDYDQETGRWTTKDPILFAGRSTNLYSYALNNPINLIDSDGLTAGWAYQWPRENLKNRWDHPFTLNTNPNVYPGPEWHWNRNQHNGGPRRQPHINSDGQYVDDRGNIWIKDKWNPFHGLTNSTYRGTGRYCGSQLTYDPNGNLINTGPQQGTFDRVPPPPLSLTNLLLVPTPAGVAISQQLIGHFLVDMLPGFLFGEYYTSTPNENLFP